MRIGKVVQTLQHLAGQGGFYEPLVVTPAIGVSLDPTARILPLRAPPISNVTALNSTLPCDS